MRPQGDKPGSEIRGVESQSSSNRERSDNPQPGGHERSSLKGSDRGGQGAERMDRGTSLPHRRRHGDEGGPSDGGKTHARLEEKPLGTGGVQWRTARDPVAMAEEGAKRGAEAEAQRKQQEQALKRRRIR